jgi:hypothetical protein
MRPIPGLGIAFVLGCMLCAGCGKYGPPRRIVEVPPPSASPQAAPPPPPSTDGSDILPPGVQPLPPTPEDLEEDQAP